MNKQTQVFQLGPMTEDITIVFINKQWYPLCSYDVNDTFIYGQGRVTIDKETKKLIIPKLETLTAKALKRIQDEYGRNVMLGMIKGWSGSLFHDQSYGLRRTRFEACNMADLGECYDTFTDEVQIIGDRFIDSLLNSGFSLQGNTLWYGYKNETECGYLLGFYGANERNHLHPLMYLNHSVGCFPSRMLPHFDSIQFDELLVNLFLGKYNSSTSPYFDEARKKLDEIVSVKDRIEHLTSKEIADDIERIFELQKSLTLP